jgi:predicted HTH domain antitoxin
LIGVRGILLAVKLFERGRVSLGKAAELCEMGKIHFMNELGKMKIPVINIAGDQIADELSDE